jgi:hypothetical protein
LAAAETLRARLPASRTPAWQPRLVSAPASLTDVHDRQPGRGRRDAELAWGGTGRGGDVGEPFQEPVEGGLVVVDRGALVVGAGDRGEHVLEVVLGLQELGFAGVFGGVEDTGEDEDATTQPAASGLARMTYRSVSQTVSVSRVSMGPRMAWL